MNKTYGCIFDIQRFSLHDGPGIRTTIFFKGCNLRCFWCHNPESINLQPEIQVYAHKCIHCGKCITVCPQNAIYKNGSSFVFSRDLCMKCGKCVDSCYTNARVMAGKTVSASEVMSEIMKDEPFYNDNQGGVTFSGGEPMLQPGFLKTLLVACKEKKIHTAVDTAGNVAFEKFAEIAPYTDLFLYDIKCVDEKKHKQVTGSNNKKILANLVLLDEIAKEIIIRIPIIPGMNDTDEDMHAIGILLRNLKKVTKVQLLPFHNMAESKYESMGMEYKAKDLSAPKKERMQQFASIISSYDINAIAIS
ncbi:MAG: glycyl-radical enzyme activating protein [Clostridiaceae bacterium]|nr:glycyl-radical enzyme activating protein [Clostridiaceae bacterium]